jgi:hypothetical protein
MLVELLAFEAYKDVDWTAKSAVNRLFLRPCIIFLVLSKHARLSLLLPPYARLRHFVANSWREDKKEHEEA